MPPRTSPPRLTHFLCIPLVTNTTLPQLRASLQAFRNDAESTLTFNTRGQGSSSSSNAPPPNLDRAIRPLGTLHLTLGVMSLLTEERVNSALSLLQSLDIPALFRKSISESAGLLSSEGERSLEIILRGLSSMHDASKTSILYISPFDPDAFLKIFCQELCTIFREAGLLVVDTRPLLLHATVFNTVYMPKVRERGNGGENYGHGKFRAKTTVDARDLMDLWKERTWVEGGRVEKIVICRMGAQKMEDGEEYFVEGEREI